MKKIKLNNPDLRFSSSAMERIGLVSLLAISICFSGCKKELTVQEGGPSGKSGRASTSAVPDFTIAVLPDTQNMVSSQYGGTPSMMTAQINWIKANQVAENIVYVASLGDMTDHGDTYASEWTNVANNGYYLLESQPGFTNGIPYGTCVGNHDQTPNTGHPLTCSTTAYNSKFGANRFRSRAYYGESYYGAASNNNDSHYDLITVGTYPNRLDLIIIYIEYDSAGDDWNGMHQWAQDLLTTYSHRKGIIVTHNLINAGIGTAFNPQGASLHNKVKYRKNCFLMLAGHTGPQGRRADTYNGNTINTVMADYQVNNPTGSGNPDSKGGNGWMRLMKFKVATNEIEVRTYSPVVNQWSTNNDNQFTLQMFTNPYVPPAILNPVADSFVRDGANYVNSNWGTDSTLVVKTGSGGYNRRSYFKFDVSSITSCSSAKLRIYGSNIESTASASTKFCSVNDDSWTETGINWSNAPAWSYMGWVGINNTLQYWEFDVTAFVQAQMAGDNLSSFCLEQTGSVNLTTTFKSREGVNKPELIIMP
ncbi:MAG TPA: DNRLRE domain-containing protein [Sphingobacteriaceae bacterium]